MMFLSAFTQFFHTDRSNQPPHTPQSSIQDHPADDAVLVDAKGGQDSWCRDFTMTSLIGSPSVTPPVFQDSASYIKPHSIYHGGYEDAKRQGVRLRIANGGAGQTGLIRAWADEFIKYMVSEGIPPFEVRPIHVSRSNRLNAIFGHQVAWYLGDTTDSLAFLSAGSVDIALTYNIAAENQVLDAGDAVERIYAYRVSKKHMIVTLYPT